MVSAATATPSGWHICRMPIASPRRSFGNQPITTRPLAALGLAAAIPPSRKSAPRRDVALANIAANAASAVIARPDGDDPALADPVAERSPARSG